MWRRGSFGRKLSWATGSFELRGRCGIEVWRFGGSFVRGSWYEWKELDGVVDGFGYDVEVRRDKLRGLDGENVQRAS